MSYYMSTIVPKSFDETIDAVQAELAKEGFGVLTEIDVAATMKKKLDINYLRYRILGACNPPFAHKALSIENRIGTMLPCNVIVREQEDGTIEVAAVDPAASMQAIENKELESVAGEVRAKLQRVISALS
mgnify:CR=1 FL=1